MAFHETDIAAERNCRTAGPDAAEIAWSAEDRTSVCTIAVPPDLHSRLDKFLFLLLLTEMFENDHCIVLDRHYVVVVALEYGHTGCIIIRCIRFIAFPVCETFGKVEAEAVDIVFVKEVCEALLYVVSDKFILMVDVMEDAERMRRIHIEPRIVGCCLVALIIKLGICAEPGKMVIHDINDDSDTPSVTLINEVLVHLACSVSLVKSEIVIWIVTPAEVAVKFLDRHELDGIHAEILYMIQSVHHTLEILCSREISDKKLIYHQIVIILDLEVRVFPVVSLLIDPEG